jgi:hypothetical protein
MKERKHQHCTLLCTDALCNLQWVERLPDGRLFSLMEHGKPGPDAVYTAVVGEKNLELCIMGTEFKVVDGENWIAGKCIHFDKTLMLFGDDGQVLVLSVNTNGTLRYHAGLSWLLTWDLPSNTKFQPLEDIVPEAA